MSAQHTPGPWFVRRMRDQRNRGQWLYYAARNAQGLSLPKTEANANLIAAAPELLAACLALKVAGPLGQREWNAAADLMDAAIAKATGSAA